MPAKLKSLQQGLPNACFCEQTAATVPPSARFGVPDGRQLLRLSHHVERDYRRRSDQILANWVNFATLSQSAIAQVLPTSNSSPSPHPSVLRPSHLIFGRESVWINPCEKRGGPNIMFWTAPLFIVISCDQTVRFQSRRLAAAAGC